MRVDLLQYIPPVGSSALAEGLWVPVIKADSPPPVSAGPTSLRIASLNVWFDRYQCETRWNRSLETLAALEPDVICLQECTLELTELCVKSSQAIQDHYLITDLTTFDGCWYGLMVLVRKKSTVAVRSAESLKFHAGRLSRGLLIGHLEVGGMAVSIATSHLESYPQDLPFRLQQLEQATQALADSSSALTILCGDFNIPKATNEEESLFIHRLGWTDAYTSFHQLSLSDDGGLTFGDWTPKSCSQWPGARLDRVVYRTGDGVGAAVKSYALFGSEPIQGDGEAFFASDHLGIVVDMECRSE
ncbi:Endonuclease/exonuclease/phosphatase [Polychytrium aggregatum]|uniref:Endonuclease/exonuclease/phosphatase n=1 Tax=Polychytrium aggregatum TaxID=110093 RepID=UPI0022FE279F|nr:Endonuclease/exonuclease/phosphatase [Polychytrium aggregatum]KAI9208963.1 Endonuclease/exonuclease/phosphatase [Polychytrium aggregatum]